MIRGQIGDVGLYCGHCEQFKVYKDDRCRGCYRYRKEMGMERPKEILAAAYARSLGREMKWELRNGCSSNGKGIN